MKNDWIAVLLTIALLSMVPLVLSERSGNPIEVPAGRSEVVFWHFWGGADKVIVEDIVDRFNRSQEKYFVRAVAMPGNNLQAKLFLSVAGEDPPDVVNQDDPILPDWSRRGVIHAMDEIADPSEVDAIGEWMLTSAQRLSMYEGRLYGVCNGLDIRALYYNRTALQSKGFNPPETISQLDQIAASFSSADAAETLDSGTTFGYLPDSRRLWAWGFVFGGDFYDPAMVDHASTSGGTVQLNTPPIRAALKWMCSYPEKFGADRVAAFRKGDQSLPGKTFPLLPIDDDRKLGRYVMIMDGQWRVRDIAAFQSRREELNLDPVEFGVCPLPYPDLDSARQNAGWVNGNFFVVPRGARNTEGAWEFMKFWIGYHEPGEAAATCAAGGWIPVSGSVIRHKSFQSYLAANPLFRPFVDLATSPNQFPIPQVPGAAMFRRTVEDAAYEAMAHPERSVEEILADAETRIREHLERQRRAIPRFGAAEAEHAE